MNGVPPSARRPHGTLLISLGAVATLLALVLFVRGGALASRAVATGQETTNVALTPIPAARGGQASPSGRILYVREGSVWVWQDGQVRSLTSGQRYGQPDWSPDGRLSIASEIGENHSDLVVFDAAGQFISRLTNYWSKVDIAESSWAHAPDWSVGNRIAYASDQTGLDMSLWTIWSDGTGGQQEYGAYLGSGGIDGPSWSPDGTAMAATAIAGGYTGKTQIFVYSTESGTLEQLTSWTDGAYDAAWSPDGEHIAFAARQGKSTSVYLMRADGSDPVQISAGPGDRAPEWSPDGTQLAYLSLEGTRFILKVVAIDRDSDLPAVSDPITLIQDEPIEAESGLSWTR